MGVEKHPIDQAGKEANTGRLRVNGSNINKPAAEDPQAREASGACTARRKQAREEPKHFLTCHLSNEGSATPLERLRSDTSTFRMS